MTYSRRKILTNCTNDRRKHIKKIYVFLTYIFMRKCNKDRGTDTNVRKTMDMVECFSIDVFSKR
jgi:hypothetical protein